MPRMHRYVCLVACNGHIAYCVDEVYDYEGIVQCIYSKKQNLVFKQSCFRPVEEVPQECVAGLLLCTCAVDYVKALFR